MPVDLAQALTDLADSLEFAGEDALAERVMAQLATPAPAVPLRRRPAVRRAAALAAAAVVIAGLVLVGSPRARRAVADLLGIGGIGIRTSSSSSVPSTPAPSTSIPITSKLGSAIAVEDGAARVGIVAPVPIALGPPLAAYLGTPPAGGRLSLVWAPSPTLPASRTPGIGALLTVFRAAIDEGYFLKVLDPDTTYERVDVNGTQAAWLAGQPHAFLYASGNGQVQEEPLWLAGNTLIWTSGPFTYRLESGLDRDAAIAVAESVPVG